MSSFILLSWIEALEISLLSIFIVFVILYAITIVIGLFKHIDSKPEETKIPVSLDDEDRVVAALVASIEYRNEYKTDFVIKSIKELKS